MAKSGRLCSDAGELRRLAAAAIFLHRWWRRGLLLAAGEHDGGRLESLLAGERGGGRLDDLWASKRGGFSDRCSSKGVVLGAASGGCRWAGLLVIFF
jgi:hypothetical protein